MSKPTARQVAVPVTSAAVVAGMMLIGAPANAATTNFTSSCQAKSIITVDKTVAASMTVDAPATVAPGETFTYRIQPNASSYPDKDSGATTTNVSRIKYDYAIPSNATYVSASVVPGTAVNLDNVAPNVLRVNDSGAVDANGGIVRLSGNNEVVGNGTSNSTNSEGGIRAPKLKKNLDGTTNSAGDSWFRLPAVDVTMVAGASGVIEPKLRTAGSAASYGNDQNFSTSLAKASLLGTQWAPTRCIPSDNKSALNAGAGPLATITINDPGPVVVDSTTTVNVPATAKTGTAVDLTATVAPAGATGTVQFKDGATAIGAPVAVTGGTATLNHTFTTNGSHSITAVYSGDATHNPSTSAAGAVEVTTDPVIVDTTTTLNVPATAKTGTAVDLTATVAPAGATGTVQFKDGATNIGAPVAVTGGTATLNHTFTTTGAHSITAVYSGDATNHPSTSAASTVDVSVNVVDTTTTLNIPATAKTGTAVDLTATVAPTEATGTVEFKDGATVLGSSPVSGGTATLNHTFTTDGTHSITAVYSGAEGFATSTSAAGTVEVSTDPVVVDSTTTLNVPSTAKTGTAVDLTATVAPTEATGTVEFKDGATVLGSSPVSGGTATLSHTFTTDGTHSITAVYSGDATHNASTSAAGTVEVSTDPVVVDSTTTVNVPATAKTGTEVSLAATVDPSTATGTVEFKDGATVLGSSPVVNGVATLNHTFTTDGTHSITAVYSGDATHNASTSAADTVEVSTDIVVVDSATTLSVPATANTGTAVDLKATVSPTDATGTVEFKDGNTVIGTAPVVNGVATLNHIFTTDGTHSITAVYSGDATHNPSTSPAATVDVSTDGGNPSGGGSLENIFGS
ncbi:beta strand repeat-containing protein [Rhodococcus sp. NPDC003348]